MPKATTKKYYRPAYEETIQMIKDHKFSAERIAYRFKAVDIGRICSYLGIPNFGLNELDDAKLLVEVLDYNPIIVEKPQAAKEDAVARTPIKADEVIEEEVQEQTEIDKQP